jgi:MFS family permease
MRLGGREFHADHALLTLTLAGDTAVSLALTTQADRIGRRRTLIAGALLMAGARVAFALTRNLLLLMVAGTVGVIGPSGNEVGPFLSVEQAALSKVIPNRERTSVFAWYTLTGAIATAVGSQFGGLVTDFLQKSVGMLALRSERSVVLLYAAMGVVLAIAIRGWLEFREPELRIGEPQHISYVVSLRFCSSEKTRSWIGLPRPSGETTTTWSVALVLNTCSTLPPDSDVSRRYGNRTHQQISYPA